MLYDSLRIYRSVAISFAIHPWWIFGNEHPHMCKRVSAVVAVMCGTQPKGMQCIAKICALCPHRQTDNPEHVLFGCEALSTTRNTHTLKMTLKMPYAMKIEFENMPPPEKVTFLVSGFRCGYTREWADIYVEAAHYVYNMYKERHNKYNAAQIT